jgi:hypothetical protein
VKVFVVHQRDPDFDCSIRVFLDGQEVEDFDLNLYDVDPGRGYTREDWQQSREDDLESARKAGAGVWLAVRDAYDAASDSDHITD